MHFTKILAFCGVLAVVESRPIFTSVPLTNTTSPDAGSDSAVVSASTSDPSVTEPIISIASASLTITPSGTDVLSVPTASATDSLLSASVSDTAISASAIDSSSPTATDGSLPSSPDSSFPSSVTDPTATDSADSTVLSASSTDAFSATSATSTSLPSAIPVPPPACVAKAANAPTSITTADPSVNTATVDPSSGNSTSSDSGLNATTTLSFSSTITSASGSASATDSASLPISTSTDNSTTLDPSASANSTVSKRIAQADLPDVAQSWQDLCLVSGGDIFTDEPCVQLAGFDGINALLANADPCAQQDNADAMIDFAKSSGVTNSDALIANAIAYRKHPRNALNVLGVTPSTPFCQKAPRNEELVGIVNDQLDGVDPGIFGGPDFGLIAFGDDGTCPLGTTADVDTCSCS